MGINSIVKSKQYKSFMSKLYGIGASVVILGALFKINHYPGANLMLIFGMGTEAIIFFFSAFEPLHVEYDWSLVYPELAGMEDLDKDTSHGKKKGISVTQELDKMLEDAKIGPELIASLGEGMRNLGENANKLSGVADAAVATDGYVTNLNTAATSVKSLSEVYVKTADVLERDIQNAELHSQSMKNAAQEASNLAGSYSKVAASIQNDINATDEYVKSINFASQSAHSLAEKYARSAESLTKSADAIDFSGVDGKNYGEQIQRISKSLSELNTIYEMQLKSTSDQLQKTDMMKASMEAFLGNLNESVESTAKYKDQVANLAQNVAALNQIYGNMLTAMNYNK